MRTIQVIQAPQPGEVIDVRTGATPQPGEVIELKRKGETVGIAVVDSNIKPTDKTYQAVVIV